MMSLSTPSPRPARLTAAMSGALSPAAGWWGLAQGRPRRPTGPQRGWGGAVGRGGLAGLMSLMGLMGLMGLLGLAPAAQAAPSAQASAENPSSRSRAAAAPALMGAAVGGAAPRPQAGSRGRSDPEQELGLIRDALLDRALAGRTRVSATSWVNEKGELLEATQFRSDLDVRGVRVVEYLGQEPHVQVEASAHQGLDPLAPVCAPPRQQLHLRHPVRMQVRVAAGQGQQWIAPAAQARAAVERALQAQATAVGTRLPLLEPVASGQASAYERAVLGREEPRQPLELIVTVSVGTSRPTPDAHLTRPRQVLHDAREWAWAQVRGDYPAQRQATLRIDFTLARPHEQAVLHYREDLPLVVSDEDRPIRRVALPALDRIRLHAERWWLILQDAMACEPVAFEARQQGDRHFRVLAGADAGLRPGDRLVLTDSRRLPRRILEADAAQHLALLEVERVEGDRAEARQVAGPPLGREGAWVALPY